MRTSLKHFECGGLTPLSISHARGSGESPLALPIQSGVKPPHSKLVGLVLACLLVLALSSLAHDSPEHRIDDLSFQIARSGKNPDLLMERAYEHRAVGHLADAAADFQTAYEFDPKLTSALKELALVQLAQSKPNLALATINRALVRRGV